MIRNKVIREGVWGETEIFLFVNKIRSLFYDWEPPGSLRLSDPLLPPKRLVVEGSTMRPYETSILIP